MLEPRLVYLQSGILALSVHRRAERQRPYVRYKIYASDDSCVRGAVLIDDVSAHCAYGSNSPVLNVLVQVRPRRR
jgi:hypothetical protein